MISFQPLTPEREREIIDSIFAKIPEADADEIEEILSSFCDCACEVAVSTSHGCILLRIFDGEYLFPYPIALTDTADEVAASDEIRLYSVKEEIPLTFIDVPSESLGELLTLFRHASAEDYDEERDAYTARVMSEAALLDEIPSVSLDGITLDALTESNKEDYARLCRDEETNRYWGYDYKADAQDADDEYFLHSALKEFSRGTALPLAIRDGGKFVGEAIIYAFDLQGGAECAIRLLTEHQGRKIGTRVLTLLLSLAKAIGLLRLYATVKNENKTSLCLFARKMEICEQNAGKTRFYTNL